MIDRFVSTVVRHRLLVLLAVVGATGGFIFLATDLKFSSSMDVWFMEDDPDLVTYERFLDQFESDHFLVAAFESEQLFTAENLTMIRRISDRIAELDLVLGVRSLTRVDEIRGVEDGVEIAPLVEEIPTEPQALAALRERVLASDLYVDALVSRDGNAAAIVVEVVKGDENNSDAIAALLAQIRTCIAEEAGPDGPPFHLAGAPVMDTAVLDYTRSDFTVTSPVMALLIVVIVLMLFRNLSAVVYPLSVVGLSVAWTFGAMTILGYEMTLLTGILVPLVMAMGIADSIHILVQYHEALEKTHDRHEALLIAFRHTAAPCLVTTLTTCAGLLSLRVSALVPIQAFALLGALGVFFAFVQTMLIGPALLSWMDPPQRRRLRDYRQGVIVRSLVKMGRLATHRPRSVLAVSFVLVLLAVLGATRLEMSVNHLEFFSDDSEVRIGTEFIDRKIGGTSSLELMLEGDEPGAFKDPSALKRIQQVERRMEQLPGAVQVFSLADYLVEMNRAMNGGNPEAAVLPENRALVAQYLLLLEGSDDLERFQVDDYQTTRVSAQVRTSSIRETVTEVAAMEAFLNDTFSDVARASSTGSIKLYTSMMEILFDSEIQSFALAFSVVMLFMLLLLRSVPLGLISSIPNLLPILLTLGFMGYAGIFIDVGTVMIASIAMGLVVDVAVHFLWRFQLEARNGCSVEEAVQQTIATTGRAVAVTTVILTLGFWTLMLGSFRPNVYFGLLTGVTVLAAMFADLVILPAALQLLGPRFYRGTDTFPQG